MLLVGAPIRPAMLFLPVSYLIIGVFTLGVALGLSAMAVYFDDVSQMYQVATVGLMYMTPIIYPIDILPHSRNVLGITLDIHRWTRILNPMASLVAAYRDVLYYGRLVGLDFLARTAITSLIVLVVGYAVFFKFSPRFGEQV